MARFHGPRGKVVRRLGGFQAFESPKFGSMKNTYPPGQHGPTMRKRTSEYGLQLREKQKIKYLYEVMEKQFVNYFKKASKEKGITGHNLVRSLEARLDNAVYRLGLASTRRQARQLVSHAHVLVNGKKVNIPSYRLSPGDIVKIREKSKKMEIIHESMKRVQGEGSYPWLSLDKANMEGIFIDFPTRDQIHDEYNEQLVVELYSK
jgi:small subunit ribosomal protein S4